LTAYGNFLLSDFSAQRGWGEVRIDTIRTQFEYRGNIPDLVLGVIEGKGQIHHNAVEHKIFAKESRRSGRAKDEGSIASEESISGQLARYFNLPEIDGVAYVPDRLETLSPQPPRMLAVVAQPACVSRPRAFFTLSARALFKSNTLREKRLGTSSGSCWHLPEGQPLWKPKVWP
jgi:hypothetical protein